MHLLGGWEQNQKTPSVQTRRENRNEMRTEMKPHTQTRQKISTEVEERKKEKAWLT